jgi:DNA-binding NarL/FixJ family response regulator
MSKIRVLVADDHGIVRKGLRFVLERQDDLEVIGEASDGREAVRICEQASPNVVVMDIAMPQLNGLDAAAQIVRHSPEIKVIILSMHADEDYLVRALNSGVKAYLLKDSAELDLVRAVRAVAQGSS